MKQYKERITSKQWDTCDYHVKEGWKAFAFVQGFMYLQKGFYFIEVDQEGYYSELEAEELVQLWGLEK